MHQDHYRLSDPTPPGIAADADNPSNPLLGGDNNFDARSTQQPQVKIQDDSSKYSSSAYTS